MEKELYNAKGKKDGVVTLPENIFGLSWNGDLVHQVMHAIAANKRTSTADTKDRSEVSGGGKKPWKQKGTGRARHGSTRSPIWVGGGVAHGPTSEKNYKQKINKKMASKALATLLSSKVDNVLFTTDLGLTKEPKTKDAAEIVQAFAAIKGFEKLKAAKKPKALFLLPEKNEIIAKSFRNLPQVRMRLVKDVNTLDVANHEYVVFVDGEKGLAELTKRMAK